MVELSQSYLQIRLQEKTAIKIPEKGEHFRLRSLGWALKYGVGFDSGLEVHV